MATTPEPPYVAVILWSRGTAGDAGYADMADRTVELAAQHPGFLRGESARRSGGFGITASRPTDEAATAAWRRRSDYLVAQRRGRRQWYAAYAVGVRRGERAYDGAKR
jgi:heme-degrading monooxygenase HmoA